MTTTERIANAIKGILEEDRRADRERIADLERDAALTRAWAERRQDLEATIDDLNRQLDEANSTVDDLNKQLDEAHKENARLILAHPHHTAPVVEEQGPWVVWDTEGVNEGGMPWRSREAWNWEICGTPFLTKEEAQDVIDDFGYGDKTMRVITLAKARAIEAKRNG